MTIDLEYLKKMPDDELPEALAYRRRMAQVYREQVDSRRIWAAHHEEVAEAIETEIARRARVASPLPD